MNEKYSVKPSSVQMALPRIHLSPLGASEDSPVIKWESHACNTSKSLLAKWKKKRRGVERGGGEIRPFREKRKKGGERRLKSKRLQGFGGENKRCFPLNRP